MVIDPSTTPLSAVGDAQIAGQAPATQQKGVILPQCQFSLIVRREKLEFERLLQLSWLDRYYWDNMHAMQWLGFRFSEALDPTLTVQSLKMAIAEYPVVGSKVIVDDGKNKFHFDAETVSLRLVRVEGRMLEKLDELQQLCDVIRVPNADQKQNPLFKAFLYKSSDVRDGSALICGFQHCVGDAMSYSLFMHFWSRCYERLCQTTTLPPDLEMPPEVFAQYSLLKSRHHRTDSSPLYRHYAFSARDLQLLKQEVMVESLEGEILTTNDILCAQCAIAVAPFRFEKLGLEGDMEEEVRIYMLVDSRGRCKDGREINKFGNFVSDIALDFAWRELLDASSANVVRVARKIRATLKQQVTLMENFAQFDDDRGERKKLRKLFCWNSWARVGNTLREAQFQGNSPSKRSNLQEMTWFNAAWSPDVETVVIEPMACVNAENGDPLLVVHVASPLATAEAEGQSLGRFWWTASVRED